MFFLFYIFFKYVNLKTCTGYKIKLRYLNDLPSRKSTSIFLAQFTKVLKVKISTPHAFPFLSCSAFPDPLSPCCKKGKPCNYSFSIEVKLNLKDYKYEQNSVLDLRELYRMVIILTEIITINIFTSLITLKEGFTHVKLHLIFKTFL